jgi:hypothetical protein
MIDTAEVKSATSDHEAKQAARLEAEKEFASLTRRRVTRAERAGGARDIATAAALAAYEVAEDSEKFPAAVAAAVEKETIRVYLEGSLPYFDDIVRTAERAVLVARLQESESRAALQRARIEAHEATVRATLKHAASTLGHFEVTDFGAVHEGMLDELDQIESEVRQAKTVLQRFDSEVSE